MKSFATKTELMPHQIDSVEKLLPSRIGALFAEMGTGKSRMSIELAKIRRKKIDHIIWFTPVSLKDNVYGQILEHTVCDKSDIFVFDDKVTERTVPDAMWYVIGIESMSSSARTILTANQVITDRSFVLLDESTFCKNHFAKRTERITRLSEKARYRMILTGTPLTQGVVDLYAQMAFLSKKILGYNSFYSFASNHLEYSEDYPGMIVRSHNTEYLAAKIKPYVYQVTKEECLDLPKKLYETRYTRMTGDQKYLYELAKNEILDELDINDFDSTVIFRLFTALQGIVSGYWNRKGELIEIKNNRPDKLRDVLSEIPIKEKVIIWGKYRYDVRQISKITSEYIHDTTAFYHGGLSEKKRAIELEKFRKDARFLIATPGCGGRGLTLNEAHYVIFYDNSFKYSERDQSEDRCHRIGQENNVTYIDIECMDSIDERISDSLRKKSGVLKDFKREIDKVKKSGANKKVKELIRSL